MVPQPLHWKRPPQSPVWHVPVPAPLKTQPVRPQKRVFRLFGVVIVTLCPAGSTQPVAASGVVALGAAATQIVCAMSLTNVTRRWSPAGWPAAPEGGGLGAAGAVGEPVLCPTDPAGDGVPPAGVSAGIRASVGLALPGSGDGRRVAVRPAAVGLSDPFPGVAVAPAVTELCPPAALVPRAA